MTLRHGSRFDFEKPSRQSSLAVHLAAESAMPPIGPQEPVTSQRRLAAAEDQPPAQTRRARQSKFTFKRAPARGAAVGQRDVGNVTERSYRANSRHSFRSTREEDIVGKISSAWGDSESRKSQDLVDGLAGGHIDTAEAIILTHGVTKLSRRTWSRSS
jgi:hypothetical protein